MYKAGLRLEATEIHIFHCPYNKQWMSAGDSGKLALYLCVELVCLEIAETPTLTSVFRISRLGVV